MSRRSTLAPPDDLGKSLHNFLYYRGAETSAKTLKDRARDALKSWLTTEVDGRLVNGREDENGHRFYDSDPVTIDGVTYAGVKAQRNLSLSIDVEKAEELARARGVYDLVFPERTVRDFNEDELFRQNQLGVFTDEELDGLEVTSVSYSLTAVKG